MTEHRYGSHTVSRLTAHLVWITKYRYDVLKGDVQLRCRELIIQICDAEDVRILQQEFPALRKQYWGRHFWAIGYGAWSTGNVTEEVVKKYLEHHRHPSNREADEFILE